MVIAVGRRDDVHIVHHNNSDISPLYKPKFNKQMNIRDAFRFRRHRRVIGKMRDAAIGHATTVYGAIVTLAAFYTLWIVILHCEEENQPHRIFTRYMEKGNEIIAQLDAYILLNGHICFVADRSRRFMFINPMKHKGKGQVFTALPCEPGKERFCVTDLISRSRPHEYLPNTDSGHVWYLDFDFSYGGKATLQGVRHCP